MLIKKSSVVKSMAGRDRDMFFIVLDIIDENFCLLTDGKLRRVENPKKKKLKHVRFQCENNLPIAHKIITGEKITNSEVRKAILSLTTDFN